MTAVHKDGSVGNTVLEDLQLAPQRSSLWGFYVPCLNTQAVDEGENIFTYAPPNPTVHCDLVYGF